MNWDQIEGNWRQVKGQIQAQWGKLTDDELDRINGSREEMVGRLQELYGLSRERAQEEIDSWMAR